jgi:HlyD family secretion protein
MRLAQGTVLLSTLLAGVSYTSERDSSRMAFLTAPVERGAITTLVKSTGTLEALVTVAVSSQLSGHIADVFVNFNDTVRAGQPLAKLDSSPA